MHKHGHRDKSCSLRPPPPSGFRGGAIRKVAGANPVPLGVSPFGLSFVLRGRLVVRRLLSLKWRARSEWPPLCKETPLGNDNAAAGHNLLAAAAAEEAANTYNWLICLRAALPPCWLVAQVVANVAAASRTSRRRFHRARRRPLSAADCNQPHGSDSICLAAQLISVCSLVPLPKQPAAAAAAATT